MFFKIVQISINLFIFLFILKHCCKFPLRRFLRELWDASHRLHQQMEFAFIGLLKDNVQWSMKCCWLRKVIPTLVLAYVITEHELSLMAKWVRWVKREFALHLPTQTWRLFRSLSFLPVACWKTANTSNIWCCSSCLPHYWDSRCPDFDKWRTAGDCSGKVWVFF